MKSDLIGKKFPVLNDGHVILLDYMGDDHDIAQAARTSYGKGTKRVSDDKGLIRYLMRHWHSTPFEMAELKFHIRVPMDTWRQFIRHRTASVNEYSTRYSEAINSMATTKPDEWRIQSSTNKQGSGGHISREDGNWLSSDETEFHAYAKAVYRQRLDQGVSREQARKDLPLSTYTEAIWKIDLHNLLHFLRLRMDGHAQLEIRIYANVIGDIVEELFPITWQAFLDYRLESIQLTRLDAEVVFEVSHGADLESVLDYVFSNKRERQECIDKLRLLGFGIGG